MKHFLARFSVKEGRRGSILVIVMFALVLAIVTIGTLQVARALYASNRETAQNYARIQTYRAATEISTYQYLNELESLSAKRDLSGDWIGVGAMAVYTEAVQLLVDSISRDASTFDPNETTVSCMWHTVDVVEAIAGANVSNPEVIINMIATLTSGRTNFKLWLSEYPEVDWDSVENTVVEGEAFLKLRPLEVNVRLLARGEELMETLTVEGLYLYVITSRYFNDTGWHTDVLMSITEGEYGLEIYRH